MNHQGSNGGIVQLLSVKPPDVAGLFYPDDPHALACAVDQFVSDGRRRLKSNGSVKAVISPHAGYRYCGPVAGSAFAALEKRAGTVERIILIGPAHRALFTGVAVPSVALFDTPLGSVTVEHNGINALEGIPGIIRLDAAFAQEHSLEVQLPFIQRVFPGKPVVPLLAGQAEPALVSSIFEHLWADDETVIVVSSDLSHFLDYESASRRDRATSAAITALEPTRIGYEDACGRVPVQALMAVARDHGLIARTLDVRNSGDTAGGRARVVGYGAYAFEAVAAQTLGNQHRRLLLKWAARAIQARLDGEKSFSPPTSLIPPELSRTAGTFVTLHLDGRLRGCIGSLQPYRSLAEDVVHNAQRAAFEDPRFVPMTRAEFERVNISISVMSAATELSFGSEIELAAQLEPLIDGLILKDAGRSATFLPAVWEQLPDPVEFLAHLKQKAGWSRGYWSSGLKAWRYRTETFTN